MYEVYDITQAARSVIELHGTRMSSNTTATWRTLTRLGGRVKLAD
jgi:hypothetical protein